MTSEAMEFNNNNTREKDLLARPIRTIEPRFLCSEYIPSDLEATQTKALLAEEQKEDEQYEKEVAHALELVERLRRGQRELRANMDQRRGTLSCLRKIPTEIWVVIFSIVCSSARSGYLLHIDSTIDPRIRIVPTVVLSQVCVRWRRIAFGSSELWNSISIHFAKLSETSMYYLKLFLDNSKGSFLNVRIQDNSSAHPWMPQIEEDHLELFAQHLPRCWRLTLQAKSPSLLNLLRGVQEIRFPHLIVYDEETRDDPIDMGERWWAALKNAPELRTVSTYTLQPSTTPPYSQLTKLKFRNLQPEKVLGLFVMLPLCAQLKSLTLGLEERNGHGGNVPFSLARVELPSLRVFIIESPGAADIDKALLQEVFESLEMPSIQTFHLHCQGLMTMMTGWPPALLEMLERTRSLRQLLLSLDWCSGRSVGTTNNPSLVSPLLRVIPNVETLVLAMERARIVSRVPFRDNANIFLSELFSRLAQPNDPVVPKLADVRVYMTDIVLDTSCAEVVLEAAAARSPMGALAAPANGPLTRPISYLSVVRFSPEKTLLRSIGLGQVELKPALLRKIQDLGKEGVRVVIEEKDGLPALLQTSVGRWW
ncbi:hypothetical protein V5O48_006393 [Marasmius crinis-equi]|uniref:F-box domain-containing protein n=1 Tax=Marasmius crinis-equi TaxID=585013 RepID=A0ABR3FJK8_9AGAR